MTTAIKINQNDGKTRNIMTGGETTADFDFPIYADTHLDVYKTATDGSISLLVKDTGYTVPSGSVGVQAGGTINLITPAVSGEVYTIYQAAPQSRTTDFNQAGDFFADVLNRELDLITQQIQQLRRDLVRAPLAPVDTTLTALTLPDPIDGYGFVWDGVAGVIRNTTSSLANIEANGQTITDNLTAINTVSTNITAVNTASTNIAAIIAAPTEAANAASSASDAATALSNTQAARDATFAALDSFDDRYLGAKTSDPTLDNDGDALIAGTLYFNSVDGVMKIYTGSVWVAAYVEGTDFLARANNLSDLVSASSARTNLGLGALATLATINTAQIQDAAVTSEKLDPSIVFVPTGTVIHFAGTSAPTGFLVNDGSAVSRSTYAALFAVIGETYGSGDGSTTFNLPNEVTNNKFRRSSGGSLGVGNVQSDELKSHKHLESDLIFGDGSIVKAAGSTYTSSGTNRTTYGNGSSAGTYATRRYYTDNTGGTETRPHNIAYLPCIKT